MLDKEVIAFDRDEWFNEKGTDNMHVLSVLSGCVVCCAMTTMLP